MKRFLSAASKLIFSRVLVIIIMILLQIMMIVGGGYYLANMFPISYYALDVLGAIIIISVINKDEPAEFKLTWAIAILLLPIVGILLYVFNQSNYGMLRLKIKADKEIKNSQELVKPSDGTIDALSREDIEFQRFSYYMNEKCHYPVYHNTKVTYYPIGEEQIEAIKEELLKAKRFIFIEFFIISEGQVWNSVLEILKQKVAEGVEVKVMYDGLCSLFKLPYRYPAKLKAMGIDAKMFAPIIPFLSTAQNNRDHRKIVVVDGHVAFTGGVNLADEYANIIEVYGHWKDVGVRIEGRAVMSMTRMFIQNWNLYGDNDLEYEKYLAKDPNRAKMAHDGFVIPYGDMPTSKYELGKDVYEDMFVHSNEYIHVMSPYFIVDREFLENIRFASHRGVDVKLILPHIPDKKIAFAIARSFYRELLDAGVKVYEYTPGFVHAKVVVSDDKCAAVGSINLDYRSFYHHFECGVYMHKSSAIKDIEEDFNETLGKCQEVTIEYYNSIPRMKRAIGRIFRLLAPLM